MCTAATYRTENFYFGRNLDYDFSYGEEVTVVPRKFSLPFRDEKTLSHHYAMIGIAHVAKGYPLYYDAVNEKGLCIAGLSFAGNAFYRRPDPRRSNIAQFELIPWLLGQCASVSQARRILGETVITDVPFSDALPPSPLHWMLADRLETIVIEPVREGLKLYDNPVGVLTNDPPFPLQTFNLNHYMGLSPQTPENRFSDRLPLFAYSRGMGALGLPGDLSSQSRFVRAAFTRLNARSGNTETESVGQFFHILGSVEQQRGCCMVENGNYEITRYAACCNADCGIYYYATYDNRQITAVRLHREDLDGDALIRYPLIDEEQLRYQN